MVWTIFRNHTIGILACFATFVLLGDAVAHAQSETEAKFVMQDIQSWLPGQFDNDPQTYLEKAFGTSDDGPHYRAFVTVEALPDDLGEGAFYLLQYRVGGRYQAVGKQHVWQFLAVGAHVVMKQFDIASDTAVKDYSDIGTATCEVRWMRGQSEVYAVGKQGDCATSALTPPEIRLSDEGMWIMNMSDATARTDGIPFKYSKARDLECFVYAMHDKTDLKEGQADRTVLNPIYLHDRGDIYTFETKEKEPRAFTLHLRRSLWASRSGRNFVPLLSLTLYSGDDLDGTIAGNAWADGNSTRVGFDAGGRVGARCKHFTERRPEAQP